MQKLLGPFTGARDIKEVSEEDMDLAIVSTAGPYLDAAGQPDTVLPTPPPSLTPASASWQA